MSASGEFLTALLGAVGDDDLWFLLWTLQDKRSHWHQVGALDDAEAFVESLAETNDVYLGVSLFGRAFGERGRGTADDSAGIVGLWLDVDIADPVHQKAGLPPTQAAAEALIESMGAEPSIVIHSGHGLQAWWLFPEAWRFVTNDERKEAQQLAARWNATLRVRARQNGYAIDSTYDLARVMRVAGTTNRKAEPVPVVTIATSDRRYDPSDLEELCLDDAVLRSAGRTYVPRTEQLLLDATRRPPADKLESLKENNPDFRKIVNADGTKAAAQYDSASERDLALSNYAAAANWEDQEIADLIISVRRSLGIDLKLRPDYYGRTIAKARIESDYEHSLHAAEELSQNIDDAKFSDDPSEQADARTEALKALSAVLHVEVVRVIKYLSEPAVWRLVTPGGEITLGEAAEVLTAKKMKQKLYEVAGVVLPDIKQPKWDKVALLIQKVVDDEALPSEATDAGQVRAWLADFLSHRQPVNRDEVEETDHPFYDGDEIVIFSNSFRQWLKQFEGERINNKELGVLLRLSGAQHAAEHLIVQGKRTTRSVWRIPQNQLNSRNGKAPTSF